MSWCIPTIRRNGTRTFRNGQLRGRLRIKLAPADDSAQIPLSTTLDDDLRLAANPRQHLAQALIDGLRKLDLVRDRFDVVVFYLPHRFQPFFEDKDTDFDLHDTVKAVAAQLGLTTQIVTDDALTYRCRASVAWRLGTALYAKAGGSLEAGHATLAA